jgi:hypothetical protein
VFVTKENNTSATEKPNFIAKNRKSIFVYKEKNLIGLTPDINCYYITVFRDKARYHRIIKMGTIKNIRVDKGNS